MLRCRLLDALDEASRSAFARSAAWSSGPPAVADARGAFRDVRRAARGGSRVAPPRASGPRDAPTRSLETRFVAVSPPPSRRVSPRARRAEERDARVVAGALRPGHGHPARRVRVRGVRLPGGGHARRGRARWRDRVRRRLRARRLRRRSGSARAIRAGLTAGGRARRVRPVRRAERRRGRRRLRLRAPEEQRSDVHEEKHAEPEVGRRRRRAMRDVRAPRPASADAHPGRLR